MIQKYFIALVLVLLFVYGLIEAWPLIIGPSLTILSPEQNARIDDGITVVRGNVARISSLTLNDMPILGDENGSFSSTFTFAQGTSILTLTAKDRFGRTITQTRTIYVP